MKLNPSNFMKLTPTYGNIIQQQYFLCQQLFSILSLKISTIYKHIKLQKQQT